MMKLQHILFLSVSVAISTITVAAERDSVHAKKTLEIYTKVISIPTVAGRGRVPEMANYLASEFIAAGFPKADVKVIPKGEAAALTVRYRGDGSSGKKPILFLGHMDVVEALPEDWERPPFELTKDDNYFYARGSIDNKLGVTMLSSTFIRLKKEGFVPNRDLIIAFSGDEETGMVTTRMLANQTPELAEAEFALNSDAGGGDLRKDGKAVAYLVQAAEKTYATFELTVRNPGGHSSRPRADNAIYGLANALSNIQAYNFPVRSSKMTRDFFRTTGTQLGGELGEAMVSFADNPEDEDASARLGKESSYVGTTRTTCIATMLRGGHAENALPQSATATVNCRIFPGIGAAATEARLKEVVDNEDVNIELMGEVTESPSSKLRPDVLAAIQKSLTARGFDAPIVPYLESGGTDGMHYRTLGYDTVAISGAAAKSSDMFAHGLNERLPVEGFYGGLDHWHIILKDLASD